MIFNFFYLQAIRKAISNSFDTVEMIRLFGDHSSNALVRQLEMLEKDFQLKKIPLENFELQKVISQEMNAETSSTLDVSVLI